jgi:hypothetical protein
VFTPVSAKAPVAATAKPAMTSSWENFICIPFDSYQDFKMENRHFIL